MSHSDSGPNLYSVRHSAEGDHAKSLDEMKDWCNRWFKYWGFQKEKGDSGYVHWQCIGSLFKRRPEAALKKSIKDQEDWLPMHLTPMNKTVAKEVKGVDDLKSQYAAKTDTRLEGPWFSDDKKPRKIPACYDIGDKMNRLQKVIVQQIESLQVRDILFVYGEGGCVGKSTLAMYLLYTRPNTVLCPATMITIEDMMQWCCDLLKDNVEDSLIILDIPRGLRGEDSWRKWMVGIEALASGFLYEKRYHAQFKLVSPPKVLVFSNEEPPSAFLTLDRFIMLNTDEYAHIVPAYRDNKRRKITLYDDGTWGYATTKWDKAREEVAREIGGNLQVPGASLE